MKLTIKKIIMKLLFQLKNPFIIYILIFLLSKRNLYVDKKYLNRELFILLKRLKGFHKFSISSTGSLILFYTNKVIKIPLGDVSKESLKKNYDNYLILKNSEFNTLVDYKLDIVDKYYEMDNLENTTLSNNEVKKILEYFNAKSKKIKLSSIKDKLFYNLYEVNKICGIENVFFEDTEIKSCPMHGDLTENNIMQTKSKKIVLIDLDRFVMEGIAGFDLLHFEVDKKSRKLKVSFFECIKQMIDNSVIDKNKLFLYIKYRVSQEHNFKIQLDKNYYDNFKSLLNDK
ncbi:hypothetical protein [Arcobacter lacus]|uniref:Aminoglycoside phosphotransferase domain-containing protein n=1 Tax=Arcobacter lacus TaxID=1912876 RepID=A0ABX5JPK6_9BACT|nr:hypothetical protein [Arcobacter lacus]PUE67493.1 hypothetical protein B0175_00475 [Arcobacter lacus]